MDVNNWIRVEEKKPTVSKNCDCSENVLAVCGGKVRVMAWGYIHDGEQGGWVWSDCNMKLDGDPEFDDEYIVTHWQPIPALPHN